jgi:hypothetical protein
MDLPKDISTLSCSDSPEKPKSIKAQHPSTSSFDAKTDAPKKPKSIKPQHPSTSSSDIKTDSPEKPKSIKPQHPSTSSSDVKADSPEKPESIKPQHPSTSSPDAKMAASPDGGQSAIEIDLDLLFREQFGITFDELATVHLSKGKGVAGMAFLMFPADVQGELALLSEYLRRHQVVIFSNRVLEDWERFAKVVTEGIVLVSYITRGQLATHFVLTLDDT